MRKPTVEDCRIIDLGKIEFDRGNLTVVQSMETVPFDVKRVFYLYDIPGGEARGAHAHKECHQFLVAASGSFEVVLDDGHEKRTVYLNRPFKGLHIPPGIWAEPSLQRPAYPSGHLGRRAGVLLRCRMPGPGFRIL